jgi:heme/copper-type cytochrome/quinol oxidase subunit 2
MTYPKIKYYGTLFATFFVLLLSTEHISEALKVVQSYQLRDSGMTWLAAAGLQIFEVLTGMGVADLIAKRKKQIAVMTLLISILILFFLINVAGNILYAFSNMTEVNGRKLTFPTISELDALQIFWVLWAAIPIPLMGIAGITVMSIFKLDMISDESKDKKQSKGKIKLQEGTELKEVVEEGEKKN